MNDNGSAQAIDVYPRAWRGRCAGRRRSREPARHPVPVVSASLAAFQVHGNNLSSSWIFVRPETTRSSTSVSHANGSTSFNFADTINVATIDQ
jgi:hypothetical protein